MSMHDAQFGMNFDIASETPIKASLQQARNFI